MKTLTVIKSALFEPGDRPEHIDKALKTKASAVIIDLEDAVAPAHKEQARGIAASKVDAKVEKTVIVRVNSLESGLAESDIQAAAPKGLFAIMVPKLATPEQLVAINRLILEAEHENFHGPSFFNWIPTTRVE